jgi:hypothetical protein
METGVTNLRDLLTQAIGRDVADELIKAAEVAADNYGKLMRSELERCCKARDGLVDDSLIEAKYNQHRRMVTWIMARFLRRRLICELLDVVCKLCVDSGEGGADFIGHAAHHYETAAGQLIEQIARAEEAKGKGPELNDIVQSIFTSRHGTGIGSGNN